MREQWEELEAFEAISQDEKAKQIVLRMAAVTQTGATGRFLAELSGDRDLDEATKGALSELARDRRFLFAVEDSLHRTACRH